MTNLRAIEPLLPKTRNFRPIRNLGRLAPFLDFIIEYTLKAQVSFHSEIERNKFSASHEKVFQGPFSSV